MGFVQGTKYSHKDMDGNIVTSLDGYNSYLLIVDYATRYKWVHGTMLQLQKYIHTDEGRELWGSHDFQKMAREAGFIMEPTAADASFQNGIAECPNRTLGDMMRCLLLGANLGPKYWSWALIHAVYLKNRIPHRAIDTTSIQAYTGVRPSAKSICIFGCPAVIRLPGHRPAKLDSHTATGIFLGYTATQNKIYF
jgi:hypothetical protein